MDAYVFARVASNELRPDSAMGAGAGTGASVGFGLLAAFSFEEMDSRKRCENPLCLPST